MANDKVLKFQVAIQDNATKELDKIERQLNGIVEKFRTSVGSINAELGKIGANMHLPNMAETIKQTEQLKDSLKKGTGDIPLFKNTLEQMLQLQNFIGKNTLGAELAKIKQSINGLFAEIPNVSANSFNNYFGQLSKAYNEFIAKMGNERAMPNGVVSIQSQMQRMGALTGGDTLLRDYQAQAEQIKATVLRTIGEVRNSINATKELLSSKALDFGKISENIDKTSTSLNKLSEAFRNFNGTIGGDKSLQNMMAGMGEIIRNVKLSMSQLQQGQQNLNWGKTMQDNMKSVFQAKAELEKLVPLIEKLKSQQLISKSLGLDTSNIDIAIQRVQHLQQLLASITMNGGISISKTDMLSGLNTTQIMSAFREHLVSARNDLATQSQANTQALKNESQAQRESELAKKQSAQASAQLSQEENRLAQSIQQATNSAHGQSQVISDLKSMAMQYLSIWGAQQFVSDMANITGELELQKKSLEVILNNASAAQQMYAEIRDLSQMSPYTFEDLLKSHRQLAAFGIEAKDIFGTLKSLSDIGAGLDVEVSRLILAYGHTRSYGYLSGIQNRQFENAGIDMIGGLTDKYNKLADAAKRAGREASYVTRKDIFSKMRDRSIPFEDVQDVVMDLDRPGGRFYNMQIRQFETLGGKLRNLRNNYRIMMSELGGDNKGLLMGTVGIINDLTENWQRYARVLKGVALGYGAMKLAAMVAGKSVLAANKEITAMAAANNRQNMATTYLNTTGPWYRRMFFATSNDTAKSPQVASNSEFRNLKNSNAINNITKQRIALIGKLTEAQRAELLTAAGVNQARAAQIAGFSAWRRGLMSVRLSMIAVGQAAKSMAVALLTNPMVWLTAIVAGVTALASKLGETSEHAEEFARNMKDVAKTDLEGIKETLGSYEESGIFKRGKQIRRVSNSEGDAVDYNFSIDRAELYAHGVANVYEELKRKLQTLSPVYEKDFFDINKAKDQAGQVEEMFRKIKNIEYIKQVDEVTGDVMSEALGKTGASLWKPGTWLRGEDYTTDLKDYADSYQEFLQSFDIKDAEWNQIEAGDKQKINELMQELHLTRSEAFARLFDKNGDVKGSNTYLHGIRYRAKIDKDNAYDEAGSGASLFADSFAAKFNTYFNGNVDQMVLSFENTMNQVFTQAKIGNAEVQAQMSEQIAEQVRLFMIAAGNAVEGEKFFSSIMYRNLGAFASKELEGVITKDTRQEDIPGIVDNISKKAISALNKKSSLFSSWWKKQGKKDGEKHAIALQQALTNQANGVLNMSTWQKRAKYKYGLEVQVETSNDWVEYIQDLRKKIKETAEKNLVMSERFKSKWGIDISYNINSKDALKQMRKVLETLNTSIHNLWEKHNASKDPNYRKKIREQISEFAAQRDVTLEQVKRGKYLQDEGFSIGDPDKIKKAEDKAQKAKEKAEREREAAKRKAEAAARKADRDWINRERHYIQSLGEAYRMYKMWYKDLRSEPAALKRVREAYGDVLKDTDFKDITSIAGYQSLLGRVRQSVSKHKFNYDAEMSDERKGLITDVSKTINELFHDSFTEGSEKFTSDMEKTLERITDAFKTFEEVLKSTGDINLADSITRGLTGFLGEDNLIVGKNGVSSGKEDATKVYMPLENVADAFKNKLLENLVSITGRNFYGVHRFAEGEMETHNYLFDENASKEEIEKRVGFLFNVKDENGEYDDLMQKLIPSINKLILEWQKLAKAERDKAVKLYSDSINKLSDYKSIAQRNNADYNASIQASGLLNKLGLISDNQKEMEDRRAESVRDEQNFKATVAYANYFGQTLSLTRKELLETANVLKNQLNEKLATGRVSASEYAKEMEKIQGVLDKKKEDEFFGLEGDAAALIQGGLPGLQKFVQNQIVEKRAKLAEEYENSGLSKEEVDKKISENGDLKKLTEKSDFLNGLINGLGDMSLAIAIATGALDGLNEAAKSLADMFDALGDESKANFWSDFSDAVGGISAIFAPTSDIIKNAMSGNVAGVVSSVISSPVKMIAGPIAAFSRLHDKKIERHIEKLKEHVSKIESYTEVIARAQERTLGYDKGDMIRMYQRQYAANNYQLKMFGQSLTFNKEGAAGKAMADYYNAAGGEGVNGYQQQLNLLNEQRKAYIDMYNEEDKKKKKSKASMEEYKQKIAELDDKIIHFSEDLAKSLWGIDLKSWADQIADALANAFENGENAANAYKDAVNNIMKSVVNNILKIGILQPMMEKLQRKLFGFVDEKGNYQAGVINTKDPHAWDNPQEVAAKLLAVSADYFSDNGEGKKQMTAAMEYLNGMEEMLNAAGFSQKNNSSKTLSSGIQGTSEETSALLAGYINALRQDVSYIRILQTQFINEAWPDYIKQITGMATTLGRIDANVAAIRSVISENGALYEKVERLSDDLHSVIFGNQKLHII